MKTIQVKIGSDGTIELDFEGFIGRNCQDISTQILDALGATTVEETAKPEFFQESLQNQASTYSG